MRQSLRYPSKTKKIVSPESFHSTLIVSLCSRAQTRRSGQCFVELGMLILSLFFLSPLHMVNLNQLICSFCKIQYINSFLQQGLNVNGKGAPVSLRCIICDAPARALVKEIKLYSGYFRCDKCAQRVEWIGRIVDPKKNFLIYGQTYLFVLSQILIIINTISHFVICPSIQLVSFRLITCISYVLE